MDLLSSPLVQAGYFDDIFASPTRVVAIINYSITWGLAFTGAISDTPPSNTTSS